MDVPLSKDISLRCLCCGKPLRPMADCGDSPADSDCWDDAVVHSLVGGYGSRHDCSRFVVGVCDACVDAKVADGSLIRYADFGDFLNELEPRASAHRARLAIEQAAAASDRGFRALTRHRLPWHRRAWRWLVNLFK